MNNVVEIPVKSFDRKIKESNKPAVVSKKDAVFISYLKIWDILN